MVFIVGVQHSGVQRIYEKNEWLWIGIDNSLISTIRCTLFIYKEKLMELTITLKEVLTAIAARLGRRIKPIP